MIFCQILGIVFYGRKTMKYSLDRGRGPMVWPSPGLVITLQPTRPLCFMKYTLDKQMGVKSVETLRSCIILIITGTTQLHSIPSRLCNLNHILNSFFLTDHYITSYRNVSFLDINISKGLKKIRPLIVDHHMI